MIDPGIPPPKREHEIDWSATRSKLRSRLASRLGARDGSIEDLTQQAMIEVLRLVRREGARNLDGLIEVVARYTSVDEIRRRQRARARAADWTASLEQIEHPPDPGKDHWDSSLELLWFLLLEFLRERQAPCYTLALSYAEKGDWKAVAEHMNQGYDATRQQWSRCVRAFREALKKDPGPFMDWLDG